MVLYLYAESPVHAGGAESLGVLDLPVQREATTRYPVIWGQSLKGALRQAATDAGWSESAVTAVFGSEIASAGEAGAGATSPGSLTVGDAQLVAMPVPTLRKTFAWVTSHLALARLARKYQYLRDESRTLPVVPDTAPETGLAASADWAGTGRQGEVLGPCVVDLGVQPDRQLADWAKLLASDLLDGMAFGQLAEKLRDDLLLVGADVMPTLLSECTEFVARVQLTKEKTVQHGPFYSEYLPAETILASVLTVRRSAKVYVDDLVTLLDGRLMQVGGDETLGKGLMWTRLVRRAS